MLSGDRSRDKVSPAHKEFEIFSFPSRIPSARNNRANLFANRKDVMIREKECNIVELRVARWLVSKRSMSSDSLVMTINEKLNVRWSNSATRNKAEKRKKKIERGELTRNERVDTLLFELYRKLRDEHRMYRCLRKISSRLDFFCSPLRVLQLFRFLPLADILSCGSGR